MMIINMFAAEEADDLYLLRGIPRRWLKGSARLVLDSVHTRFGPLSVSVDCGTDAVVVGWSARWRRAPAALFVQPCGVAPVAATDPQGSEGSLEIPRSVIAAEARY